MGETFSLVSLFDERSAKILGALQKVLASNWLTQDFLSGEYLEFAQGWANSEWVTRLKDFDDILVTVDTGKNSVNISIGDLIKIIQLCEVATQAWGEKNRILSPTPAPKAGVKWEPPTRLSQIVIERGAKAEAGAEKAKPQKIEAKA